MGKHVTHVTTFDVGSAEVSTFLSSPVPNPQTSQTPKAQPQPSQIKSKSVLKGLGLTLKSYGPPTTPQPPPHPITFKHEGGL